MPSQKAQMKLWVQPETRELVETHYKDDNCFSRTEYIEKAIRFYSGYLDTEHASAYLPRILAETLEGKLTSLGDRIASLLFKLAVEEAMTANILAYASDINEGTLRQLQTKCTQDVMRTNGRISFEDALKFQKG